MKLNIKITAECALSVYLVNRSVNINLRITSVKKYFTALKKNELIIYTITFKSLMALL